MLKRHEYFGKYGKIVKIVINPNTNYAGPQVTISCSVVDYRKLAGIVAVASILMSLQVLRESSYQVFG